MPFRPACISYAGSELLLYTSNMNKRFLLILNRLPIDRSRFFFLLFTFAVISIFLAVFFRVFYLAAIKEVIPAYKTLALTDYLAVSLKTDIRLWLPVFSVICMFSLVFSKLRKTAYLIPALALALLSIVLWAGVSYFVIFQTPVDLSSVKNGLGGFEQAILFSAIYEIPPYTYWQLVAAFLLPVSLTWFFYVLYERPSCSYKPASKWERQFISKLLSKLLWKFRRIFLVNVMTRLKVIRKTFPALKYILWLTFLTTSCLLVYFLTAQAKDSKVRSVNHSGYRSLYVSPAEVIRNPVLEILDTYVYKADPASFAPFALFHSEAGAGAAAGNLSFRYKLDTNSLVEKNIISAPPIQKGVKYNIIFYFLESISGKYTNLKVDGKSLMPNWQKLCRNSFVSEKHYAHNPLSIHALTSVLSSSYEPPSQQWVSNAYPYLKIRSVSEILHEHGYRTGLFHSGDLKHFDAYRYIKKT